MPELVMPRLSDSMEEGVVLSWLKSVGDSVELGEELVEIETDKANMVYESDLAGTLLEIIADEGDVVPIGGPIARIGEPGEEPAAKPGGDGQAGEAGEADEAGGADTSPQQAEAQEVREGADATGDGQAPGAEVAAEKEPGGKAAAPGRVKASPLARRLAKEKGLDLSTIAGSGPGGRIIKRDIEEAEKTGAGKAKTPAAPAVAAQAGPPQTAKGDVEVVELNRLQQTIARRMAESKAVAPHFYLTTEIDMSACVAARAELKKSAGEGDVVPSFNDMVVKACALSLRDHPKANGSYKDGQFELHSRINVGVAVAAPGSLVVPTIFDADRKGLVEIASETRELASKVRDQTITPPELSGGTFSVSNLGMYGITEFDAVVNTPQAAILAVGAIVERPVVRDGEVTTAHMMSVTLSCDHRILYGAEGAEFLAQIRRTLEQPLALAL